jgi:hypothetical protein
LLYFSKRRKNEMGKRLILILALAFVVGIAFGAYAEVQNVKVSGDITTLAAVRNLNLKGEANDGSQSFLATIAGVRVDADLTDNVMATVKLINERYWGRADTDNPDATTTNTDIALGLAYVTLKEFLYSPLSLTVGRQNLRFGNGMIVGDPDTNNSASTDSAFSALDPDLCTRKAFDAIRATLNYDPLIIDAVYAKITTNNSNNIGNDDTILLGVNGSYVLNSKTTLEGYWFERQMGKKATNTGLAGVKKEDRVDTVGARIVAAPIENLVYQLEAAYQFGKRATQLTDNVVGPEQSVNRKAWALEASATYGLPSKRFSPTLTTSYAYFSGDHENGFIDNNRGAWRGWDPMFEDQTAGHIANALLNQTNAHVIGAIATAKAMEDVNLKGEYYAIWWAKAFPENTLGATMRGDPIRMTERRFAGQELDLSATYDYTEDVQFALLGGMLFPGPSFQKGSDTRATEVIGSMKVTF